jgi:ankyrin repeat protein
VAQGYISTVEFLLVAPTIDINRPDDTGKTPFIAAAMHRREEVVAVLAKEMRVDLRARDKHGRTVLSWAVVKGY